MGLLIHEASLERELHNVFSSIGLSLNRIKNKVKQVNLAQDIAAKIQITKDNTGKNCGYLLVVCPEKMATQIGTSFFHMLPEDLDQGILKECVQEVLNIIGGNLQDCLDNANLDIPSAIETEAQLAEINRVREKSDLIYEYNIGGNETPLFQLSIYSI